MSTKTRILVVEDDNAVRSALEDYLVAHGFDVRSAQGQTDGLQLIRTWSPELAVLDIVLQDGEGHGMLREIRKISEVPIIFLSGHAEETERIISLEIGADDYVTKPFNPRELTARIKAVLRRAQSPQSEPEPSSTATIVYFGDCVYNPLNYELINERNETVLLNNGERKLLEAFLSHPHKVMSRDRLLDATQGRQTEVFDRSIDNLVSRLRNKLEADPKSPRLIKTHWGGGYALSVDVSTRAPASN